MDIDISLNQLIVAYHKAKNEVFYEGGEPILLDFVDYEKDLIKNLSLFRAQLLGTRLSFKKRFKTESPYRFVLKKSTLKKDNQPNSIIFSDNEREWKNSGNNESVVDFRIMGALHIKIHILSSLWIDTIGVKFDSVLSENVYGNRIKRPNQKEAFIDHANLKAPKQEYESHFRAYLWDYKKWQDNGIKAIKEAIQNKKSVLAVTTDIEKYYNNIDPDFIADAEFFADYGIPELTETEWHINRLFLQALKEWSSVTYDGLPENEKHKYQDHLGIPIGLGASKIIANILLIQFDREIIRKLNPIYYGRYVDDIFLVINDNDEIANKIGFHDYIKSRITQFKDYDERNESDHIRQNDFSQENRAIKLRYHIDFSPRSVILFSHEKEKVFSLFGESGETLIGMIQEEINESSSEWKMLPDGNEEYERTRKEILSASSDSSEKANGLRKSDGITLKRQQFALYLRNTEDLVLSLPEIYWKKNMENFIRLCKTHVFTPDNIGTYNKYLRRIYRLLAFGNRIDDLQKLWLQFENCLNLIGGKDKGFRKQITSYHSLQKDILLESIYSGLNLVTGIDSKKKKNGISFLRRYSYLRVLI